MENEFPKRKRLRLEYFDYSTPAAYFITICTRNRKNILSNVVGAIHESPEIKLTDYGMISERAINNLPAHLGVLIDQYIIMPNHIHLIVVVLDNEATRAIHESPLRRSAVSKAIGYIKMNISKEIHKQYGVTEIWQRGFHDHIIRDKKDYEKISKYIYDNPYNWKTDSLYNE